MAKRSFKSGLDSSLSQGFPGFFGGDGVSRSEEERGTGNEEASLSIRNG